ncbi:heterokaryon incompatibility protein-domain-containing protein [Xylaria venustula]|nr:heterokaryon incompatibility protein-domain-containing protein [Xylaria venustula]
MRHPLWMKIRDFGRERRVKQQTSSLVNSRHWLETCVSTHKHCQRRAQDSGQTSELKNFRLIDRSVDKPIVKVHPLTERYAALSYVWGKSTASISDTAATWPKTVLDTITTTRKLGLRYLWVDKYCINQEDAVEKSIQISQMDVIYKMAEVTLIAAAGSDASFGLAGIDGTMRYNSVKIQLPNHLVLVSTHREADLAVAESPWNARGWTYQEGLFARRRLYFLPSQMYWQCHGFEAQESFQFPYKSIYEGVLRSWELKIHFPEFNEHTDIFRRYSDHISDFSTRSLTFDSDVLAACRSLSMNFTSQPRSNLSVLFGLPISTLGYKATCIPREPIAFALTSWCHMHQRTGVSREGAPGLTLPRTVLHDKSFSVERRTNFPSWSWAGWTGRVKFMDFKPEYDLHRMRANQGASGFEEEQEALMRSLKDKHSLYLWLGNCMFLFLSSHRARFQKQADFFEAIRDGYICCILLCMSPWDTRFLQTITGRFLVLRSMNSQAYQHDGGNDAVQMWERIGVLHVQVMTPSYAVFMEVLETHGMKMHDQDYCII